MMAGMLASVSTLFTAVGLLPQTAARVGRKRRREPADTPLRPSSDSSSAVSSPTLPNGLTYYILKHGKPEKRAMLWLAVKAGSVDEDDDQRGLAHFDEHMAFNGTARFPKDALVKYLESIGIRFGADVKCLYNLAQTVYQLEVPTDDPKFLDRGMNILRDWAGSVSYDPVEIEKERGVVLEEWRLRRGAGERLFDKQAQVLFKGSRYADRITIGLPEIIKGAKPEALTRFYRDWYRPDLMAVSSRGAGRRKPARRHRRPGLLTSPRLDHNRARPRRGQRPGGIARHARRPVALGLREHLVRLRAGSGHLVREVPVHRRRYREPELADARSRGRRSPATPAPPCAMAASTLSGTVSYGSGLRN